MKGPRVSNSPEAGLQSWAERRWIDLAPLG